MLFILYIAMLIANGIYFYQPKSPLKQDSEVQDMANACPMKKRRIVFCDEDDIRLMQRRIASLKKRRWPLKPEMSPVRWKNFSMKPSEYLLYILNPMKFVSLILAVRMYSCQKLAPDSSGNFCNWTWQLRWGVLRTIMKMLVIYDVEIVLKREGQEEQWGGSHA